MMLSRFFSILMAICLLFAIPLDAAAQTPAENLREAFGNTELKPSSPSSAELDAYLDSIMADIFTGLLPEELLARGDETEITEAIGSLAAYEKVLACYDYIIATVSYGSHMAKLNTTVGNTTCRAIYNSYGAVEGFGAVALSSAATGMCNAYASAFILMARKIGLNAYLVKGSTRSGGGGYVYHEWAEILVDDKIYVFDPQLDQRLSGMAMGSHIVFGNTYSDLPGRYIKN